jgi:hypothetical protein
MDRMENTTAKRSGSSDCRLLLTAPANRVRAVIHRDDFPASTSTFATLQIVHVDLLGNERVLASMGLAGGTVVHPKTGLPDTTSELQCTLGWHYDALDQPVLHDVVGSVIGRVISPQRSITRRVEVECDYLLRSIPPQHHSVAVVSSGTSTAHNNASGTVEWTDTASGSDRAVYVCGGNMRTAGPALTSVTYDGSALTLVDSQLVTIDTSFTNGGIAVVYRRVAPATTSNATIVVTLTGSGNYGAFGNYNLSGVNQSNPENTAGIVKNIGTGNVGAGAATTPTDGMLLDGMFLNSSLNSEPAGSHTELFDSPGFDAGGSGQFYWGGSQRTSSSGSQSLAWTNIAPVTGSDAWAQVIVPVQAAVAAKAPVIFSNHTYRIWRR